MMIVHPGKWKRRNRYDSTTDKPQCSARLTPLVHVSRSFVFKQTKIPSKNLRIAASIIIMVTETATKQIPIVCPGHTRPLAELQFCQAGAFVATPLRTELIILAVLTYFIDLFVGFLLQQQITPHPTN
jgi:hypothetical protein